MRKKILRLLYSLVMIISGLTGCSDDECKCAAIGIHLIVKDNNGTAVRPDLLEYSLNGERRIVSTGDLEDYENGIVIGTTSGVYHLRLTAGDLKWESEDIDVKLDGPSNCRRPKTQDLTVVLSNDEAYSEIVKTNSGCE